MSEKVFIFPEDEDVPGAQTHVIVDNTPLPVIETNSPAILADLNQVVTNTGALLTQTQLETELDEKFGDLGQKNMAGSAPVVIASDQTALPVTFTPSGTQDVNITKVGGAAVTLGAKTSATSIPVVLATDEAALPITAVSLPLPAGASTAANQTTIGSQTTKINDGTNTATVKAASTAPLATDPALVVAISPNASVAVTQSTSPWVVSGAVVTTTGIVDANNSTTSTLLANAVYTGTGTSVLNYSVIEVLVYSDVSSAINKVYIEFSSDNSNWDDSSVFTFTSGVAAPNAGQVFIAAVRGQYYRVVYTNGVANQTAFRMQAVLKSNIVGGDVLSVNQTINANNHALLTTSQIVGLSTAGGGTYVTVKVTPSGAVTNALGDISGVVGQNTMANSLPVTIASNQSTLPVSVTPTVSSTLAPTSFENLGANATLNIKATAGNVFSITCYNANASSRYIQLHNTTTVPAGGATPLYTFLVPSLSQIIIGTDFFSNNGANFNTGIAFAFSTTLNTYTAGAAADQSTIVMYI